MSHGLDRVAVVNSNSVFWKLMTGNKRRLTRSSVTRLLKKGEYRAPTGPASMVMVMEMEMVMEMVLMKDTSTIHLTNTITCGLQCQERFLAANAREHLVPIGRIKFLHLQEQ